MVVVITGIPIPLTKHDVAALYSISVEILRIGRGAARDVSELETPRFRPAMVGVVQQMGSTRPSPITASSVVKPLNGFRTSRVILVIASDCVQVIRVGFSRETSQDRLTGEIDAVVVGPEMKRRRAGRIRIIVGVLGGGITVIPDRNIRC